MPIRQSFWKVGSEPELLAEVSLGKEALLEQMIATDPRILSDRWLMIGRQVRTEHGGFIDLLALNQDGQLIVIELKREQTPREVVAQALDYASWAQHLSPLDLARSYERFTDGQVLSEAFEQKFGMALNEEQLNGSHQIVVVASVLDPSTERIVGYLNSRDVPINVICFQVFQDGPTQYLSRAWLIDPVETESKAAKQGSSRAPWNSEYYVTFAHGENRDWNDARDFGFISAGGGSWYTRTLHLLKRDDRIWVNVPRRGFVGVGRVLGTPVLASEFTVEKEGRPESLIEAGHAEYHRSSISDEEMAEYVVPIEWEATRPLEHAVSELGFFTNGNTVCRPGTASWNHTVERLRHHFLPAEASAPRSLEVLQPLKMG